MAAEMVRLGPAVGAFVAKYAKKYGMSHKDFIMTFLTKGLLEGEPLLAEKAKGRGPMTVELAESILAADLEL